MQMASEFVPTVPVYTGFICVQCTQLFLGAQCIEAGFMDDLTEELQ